MSNKIEIELTEVQVLIDNKIHDFVFKYNKYPKYLKLPLWISQYMKTKMKEMEHFNLDYNTELLLYKDLVVCETASIENILEIEVF